MDAARMAESAWWHPVALAGEVAQAPVAVQLLEQPVVLWRDATGAVQAFADQCPHRGARLSLGRVTPEGQLECPYHGWQFAAAGQCTHGAAAPVRAACQPLRPALRRLRGPRPRVGAAGRRRL